MKRNTIHEFLPPIVIGGIGGSGTRLISEALIELGFFMGNDLNISSDNLLFTHLFKHHEILKIPQKNIKALINIYFSDMLNIKHLDLDSIQAINTLLEKDVDIATWINNRKKRDNCDFDKDRKWGWKEPNSHVIIEPMMNYIPNLKYIHVIRNGFDMAHSTNQNQAKFWGKYYVKEPFESSPNYSLKFWCEVHKKIFSFKEKKPERILIIKYEDYCFDTKKELERLYNFLEITPSRKTSDKIIDTIHPPDSIGRYKKYGLEIFDSKEILFVKNNVRA